MTPEEKFYKTFEIIPFVYCSKPRLDCSKINTNSCTHDCEYFSGVRYPEITDTMILKLICDFKIQIDYTDNNTSIKDFRNKILIKLIELYNSLDNESSKKFKNQVKLLFK